MKIKSIKKVNPRKVYAIQTSSGTFIADGLAHHNCYSCNMGGMGKHAEYTLFMMKTYGLGVEEIEELLALRKKKVPFKNYHYIDYICSFYNLIGRMYESKFSDEMNVHGRIIRRIKAIGVENILKEAGIEKFH